MQKISLKNLNFKEEERLSREQLKDVLGGLIGSGGGGACGSDCTGSCTKGGVEGRCLKKSDGGCVCGTAS